MNGLIRDWIAIAEDDDSAPPMTDEVVRHLIGQVVLSGHHGLHVVNRVVKRDSHTGAPHQRRAFTGVWRLRLVAGTDEQRRRFAATMRLARITGIGRDHTIGGGRVLVELPPRSPDRSNPRCRTIPAAPTSGRAGGARSWRPWSRRDRFRSELHRAPEVMPSCVPKDFARSPAMLLDGEVTRLLIESREAATTSIGRS